MIFFVLAMSLVKCHLPKSYTQSIHTINIKQDFYIFCFNAKICKLNIIMYLNFYYYW